MPYFVIHSLEREPACCETCNAEKNTTFVLEKCDTFERNEVMDFRVHGTRIWAQVGKRSCQVTKGQQKE